MTFGLTQTQATFFEFECGQSGGAYIQEAYACLERVEDGFIHYFAIVSNTHYSEEVIELAESTTFGKEGKRNVRIDRSDVFCDALDASNSFRENFFC